MACGLDCGRCWPIKYLKSRPCVESNRSGRGGGVLSRPASYYSRTAAFKSIRCAQISQELLFPHLDGTQAGSRQSTFEMH